EVSLQIPQAPPIDSGITARAFGLATLGERPLRFELFESISVSMHRLDDYLTKFSRPVFIKIDTEGYEAPILKGAEQLIRKFRPIIQAEINVVNARQCNQQCDWHAEFCKQHSYVLVSLDNDEGMLCPKEKEATFRACWPR